MFSASSRLMSALWLLTVLVSCAANVGGVRTWSLDDVAVNAAFLSESFTQSLPLYFTIASASYFQDVNVFLARQKKFPRDYQLLVACLDADCVYLCSESGVVGVFFPRLDINALKLEMMSELLEDGFDVLFFDLDVYFTGDPMSAAAFITPSHDIVFQADWLNNTHANIGYYLAKPSSVSLLVNARSILRKDRGWDQALVNTAMVNSSVRVAYLPLKSFINLMHHDTVYYYFHDKERDIFVANSALIHFTCVNGHMKQLYALHYGLGDDDYYSQCTTLLNITTPVRYNCSDSFSWQALTQVLSRRRSEATDCLLEPRIVHVCHNETSSDQFPFHLVFNPALVRRYLGLKRLAVVDTHYHHYQQKWLKRSGHKINVNVLPIEVTTGYDANKSAICAAKMLCDHVTDKPGCLQHCTSGHIAQPDDALSENQHGLSDCL
jgi:hypothetical protein